MRVRCLFVSLVGTAMLCALAAAQTSPMGPEFQVNTYTTSIQDERSGSVAMDGSGSFILVWDSLGEDGSINGVFARRYDSSGNALGDEFQVNTYTTFNQDRSVVAMDPGGEFVVAWQSEQGQYDIFARRYDARGNPKGTEFLVNTSTTSSQTLPAVAMSASGRFVVVWESFGVDGDKSGISGQLFDDNGTAVGGEFQVNTYTTGYQQWPAVAMGASGDFVVAWESPGEDGDGYGIFARRYGPGGDPIGPEIPVNAFTTGNQRLATAGMDRSGNFVVAWESDAPDNRVVLRRFDADGLPLTPDIAASSTSTSYAQYEPSLAMDRDGNFVLGWGASSEDGDQGGVFARAFDASVTPTSGEFQLNVTTTANQLYASVAFGNLGQFVAAWENTAADPEGDVFARQSAPAARPMAVDARSALGTSSNHNGVLESGETVQVAPAYRNSVAASFSLAGTASNLAGPAGPTYTLIDADADYGTLGTGAANDCFAATGDCFVVGVSGTRPAAHWDVSFDELLTTGIKKTWTLHVGESFPDVTTAHPFYAYVENLFHNGVTGGCGSGDYRPAASVTRGQMAVFLLKAEHGASYTPPACTGVFPDVTCPSAFADWIEQLFHEGITGGCGNGNYCPDNPVTRAQMAVFLLKAEHGSSYAPPVCTGVFPDVTCPSTFAAWIEQLFHEDITAGCGNGDYCPDNPNARGQMAVFLVKTFGLQLYGP